MRIGESPKDRRLLVREAGFRPTSAISVFAGTLVAFGLVAVGAVIGGAVISAVGLDTETMSRNEWRLAGTWGAVVGVAVVFCAFLFGGYTAGRMSRRMGFRHGALVFVCGAALVAALTGLVALTDAWTDLRHHLSVNDIPTGSSTWSGIAVGAAIAAAAAMLLGSMLGGLSGDRWHTRLTAAAERNRARAEAASEDEQPRPRRALGEDETELDLRDRIEASESSVEEERENARAGRADVGM